MGAILYHSFGIIFMWARSHQNYQSLPKYCFVYVIWFLDMSLNLCNEGSTHFK